MSNFVKPTDDTVYPATVGRIDELEHQLRHYDAELTTGDRLLLASVLAAYKHLVNNCTQRQRNKVCSAIKRLSQIGNDSTQKRCPSCSGNDPDCGGACG